ncbi:sulfotransferase [Chloroflexota bacterium]
MKNTVSKHSQSEKFLHDLAFKSWFPRISLSNIESRIYKNQLASIQIKKPVFITALPRAGTTLLLELCVSTNEFASHTYSDMPFLLTPLLWNRLSKQFRHADNLSERVHGDGIIVNIDSPESFEEVIWKEFWPSRYRKNRIIPWKEPSFPIFEQFFRDHMRKIILLHSTNASQSRYISKNNLNLARIRYLRCAFPDSIILIPFRSPLEHASSLLRQYLNFSRIHVEDPFARKYMEDTGHFDFGQNLRPIDFDNWLSGEQIYEPSNLSFWLQYWISTYQFLLNSEGDKVRFFSYDLLCNNPHNSLQELGESIELENSDPLIEKADRIIAPKPYDVDTKNIPTDILDKANTIFSNLRNSQK